MICPYRLSLAVRCAPGSRQHLRSDRDFAREYRCPVAIDFQVPPRYIDGEFVILAAISGSRVAEVYIHGMSIKVHDSEDQSVMTLSGSGAACEVLP